MLKKIVLEANLQKADKLIKNGDFSEALQLLEKTIAEDPQSGKAYTKMAWFFDHKLEEYEQAEKYYKIALENDNTHMPAYYNYGILLVMNRRYDELNVLLKKALEIKNVDHSSIYFAYGVMFEYLEEYDLAIEKYKESIRQSFSTPWMEKGMQSMERCRRKSNLFSKDY